MARRWITPPPPVMTASVPRRSAQKAREGPRLQPQHVLWGLASILLAILASLVVQLASRHVPPSRPVPRVITAGWPWPYARWSVRTGSIGDIPPSHAIAWGLLLADLVLLALCFAAGLWILGLFWRALWRFGEPLAEQRRWWAVLIGLGLTALWDGGALQAIGAPLTVPQRLLALPAATQISLQQWFEHAPGPGIWLENSGNLSSLAMGVEWLAIIAVAIGLPGALLATATMWVARWSKDST